MAVYNEILAGRFNRALQKLFGIKGPPAVPQLGGEIVPSVSMFYGVENRYLEAWERFGFQIVQAAVVGQAGSFRLRNPVNSGTIAVLEKITVWSGAAGAGLADQSNLAIGATALDLATPITTLQRLDPRGRPNSGLIATRTTNAAAIGFNIAQTIYAANQAGEFILFEEQEIPILPGDAVMVSGVVFNQAFACAMLWRERSLEESERT